MSLGDATVVAGLAMSVVAMLVREARRRREIDEACAAKHDLQVAIDTIPAIVWITAADGTVEFMNRAWRDFTGVSSAEAPQRWVETLHPDEASAIQSARGEAISSGRPYELDARLRRADGTYRWVLRRAVPLRNDRGEIVKWFGTGTDIDDLKRAQRAARRARERALTARFTAALGERSRLAREIHDTLLQGFAGVALQLTAVSRRLSDTAAAAAIGDVIALAQRTLDEARQAVWDLREPAAVAQPFATTLRQLALDAIRGSELQLDFDVRGVERPIAPDCQSVAERVLRESVANVIKHAGARSVRVRLAYKTRSVRLRIADDGRGFQVDPAFGTYGAHWGLLGMSERATEVGGRLTVRSAPGGGTRVVLRLPHRVRSARRSERALPERGIAGGVS